MNLSLRISDKNTGELLSSRAYSEMKLKEEVEQLEYLKLVQGGCGTLTFNLKREPRRYWPDLKPGNVIRLYHADEIAWEGDIQSARRESAKDSSWRIGCVGPAAKMKVNGTYADLDLDLQAGETASTWFTDHMLADTYLGFSAGTIQTTDYELVTGRSFFPGKNYWDIADDLNTFNGWLWRVRPGGVFDWMARPTSAIYKVRLKDCEKSSLDTNREGLYNWVQYAWTGDGETYGYVTAEDTDSQETYGMRRYWDSVSGLCTEEEAQQVADTFISLHKDLKPSSALTTDIVRNMDGAILSPHDLVEGELVYISDLAPSSDEPNTWEVKEIKFEADRAQEGMVTLSPGEPTDTLAKVLAQIDARSMY